MDLRQVARLTSVVAAAPTRNLSEGQLDRLVRRLSRSGLGECRVSPVVFRGLHPLRLALVVLVFDDHAHPRARRDACLAGSEQKSPPAQTAWAKMAVGIGMNDHRSSPFTARAAPVHADTATVGHAGATT